MLTIGCSSNNDSEENKLDDQQRMVQATTQIALKDYNISAKTSSSLNDWTINNQPYDDTFRWIATTYDNNNNKIKCIFEWSGNNDDDLILVYLFFDGEEFVNDL